jgi:glycerol-3-phosphate acyltransferase PlsX
MNFIGNVEGHDLFTGHVDVVVCDGFVGNVVLKSCEQMAKSMGQMIKQQVMKRMLWKVGALLSKGAFQEFKKTLDPSEVGGAPLLGVNGSCVIGHGNSNPMAVRNGIRAVGELVRHNVNDAIVDQIHQYGLDNLISFN